MIRRRVVIVGAGPAGMAAAIALAEAGLSPTVVDENPAIGGQIYRQPPATFRPAGETNGRAESDAGTRDIADDGPRETDKNVHLTDGPVRGAALRRRFFELGDKIELLAGTCAWGVFPPRRVAISRHDGWRLIDAEHLVLAPGAYEYVPPFPGWTLPGVMTPGGAQSLVKTMKVRPGKRALVAGSGPFLLVVAAELHAAGVEVVGVVEAARRTDLLRRLPGLLSDLGTLREGSRYLGNLRRAAIPLDWGHMVVAADGDGQVQRVAYAPCDRQWQPNRRHIRTVEVDTLCIGYGFVPRSELAQAAGCRLRFTDELGGWIPEVDERLQTSVPGVWAAGDGGGVAGAVVAELEGTLVGLAIAQEAGKLSPAQHTARRDPIERRLARLRRFRAALDQVYRLRPGLCGLPARDTVVCRCEELTLDEVETGICFGGTDIRTLKVMTRLGMGLCQGRMCWPATARLIAARTGTPLEKVGPLSIRPPLRPVCVGDLLEQATLEPSPMGAAGTSHGAASAECRKGRE